MSITIANITFDHVVYDDQRDVLYLSVGDPREAADSLSTPEGHVLRYDENGAVIGVTIINAKWLQQRDGKLYVSLPERVTGDVKAALA